MSFKSQIFDTGDDTLSSIEKFEYFFSVRSIEFTEKVIDEIDNISIWEARLEILSFKKFQRKKDTFYFSTRCKILNIFLVEHDRKVIQMRTKKSFSEKSFFLSVFFLEFIYTARNIGSIDFTLDAKLERISFFRKDILKIWEMLRKILLYFFSVFANELRSTDKFFIPK